MTSIKKKALVVAAALAVSSFASINAVSAAQTASQIAKAGLAELAS